jgi:hypothetical protein
MPFETVHLLSRLIQKELNSIRRIQSLVTRLNSGTFNMFDAFHSINA